MRTGPSRHLGSAHGDYLVKPLSATELVAWVRAALYRRTEPEPFVLGGLAIHYAQRTVSVAGRAVRLTAVADRPNGATHVRAQQH